MRRILKTTTAIVASLSLIAPQIAPAFAQGAPAQEQVILPQKALQERQQQQQRKQQEQKQKEQKARAEQQRQQQQRQQQRKQQEQKAHAEQQQQQRKQQEQQQQQQQQRRERAEQQEKQQRPKPQVQQAQQEQPRKPKPAEQQKQAQPEQRRPQPQREQRQPEQAKPRPQPKDQPGAPDRARDSRDAARNAVMGDEGQRPQRNTQQQPPRAEPGRQQKAPPANADELRRAMEEKQRPRQNADQQRMDQQRRAGQQGDAQRADEARRRQQQANQQRPNPPRPDGQRAVQPGNNAQPRPLTAEQLRQRQEQQRAANQNTRPQPQQLTSKEMFRKIQTGEGKAALPAPEARHTPPNALARQAAERNRAPAAAALTAAAAGNQARGEVRERRITQENARRSNQDFHNRIEDGMQARDARRNEQIRRNLDRREQELRQDERRVDRRERQLDRRDDYRDDRYYRDNRYYDDDYWNDRDDDDDDDDHGSDIAKLLLAGVAGYAVGSMLSGNRQVALNTGDRAVLTLPDGSQQIVRDDNALLYQPGSDVQTETFNDGSTRTTVLRADGSRVVTIRDADTNVLQRTLIRPDGTATRLMDNTNVRPVQVSTLPAPQPVEYSSQPWNEDDLRTALLRESGTDRRFTLGQIRDIPEVRSLVAPVNVPDVTFDTGSAALSSDQAEQLATLGKVIRDSIDQNPNEVYMIEGYTDAVGSNAANLALSDRRAESVALALTEYYQVPPENMVVQGYGEEFLLVPTEGDTRDNRRVAIRRITDLLEQSGS